MDDEWLAHELRALTEQAHPPFDPERVLRQLGYEVRTRRLVGTRHMVEHAITHPSTREVFLNAQLSPSRKRFTVAHELGHVMRHHDLGALARDGKTEPPEIRRVADRFATSFLLPEDAVMASIQQLGRIDVDLLSREYGVSSEAMRVRLRQVRAARRLGIE